MNENNNLDWYYWVISQLLAKVVLLLVLMLNNLCISSFKCTPVFVEVEFYNFEIWVANNLQNLEMDRKSPLGHQDGAGQGGFDDQVSDC